MQNEGEAPPVSERFPHYLADQRAFHDAVVTEMWGTFNWEKRKVREAFDTEQILEITGPHRTILQVGCGTGSHDPIFADYGFVETVHAIDPSPKSIEKANEHFPHPKVTRWVAGFDDLADDARYDLTYSVDVFEHIDRPDAFLAKMRSVVRPGGYVAILTPNRNRWDNIARLICGRDRVLLSPQHIREYSRHDLIALAKRHALAYAGYFGEGIHGPFVNGLSLKWQLRLGLMLSPLAHVIGVVFKRT